MQRHFINEVHYLTKLQHPNIVRVIETATNWSLPVLIVPSPAHKLTQELFQVCSYIAMEFADKGNLFEYVSN
jgi:serine/threonine protein kinase